MMKKIATTLCLWFGIIGTTLAETLSVDPLTIGAGETAQMAITLDNDGQGYTAYQFLLTLSTGVTLATDQEGQFLCSLSQRHGDSYALTVSPQDIDGQYLFVCYSPQSVALSGTEGTLLTVTLKADASMVGQQLNGQISDILFSDADGNKTTMDDATFPITILEREPEPYAVLSDDNTVLTFYYDKLKEERNGMSVGPFNESVWNNEKQRFVFPERGWDDASEILTTVVFDSSFADCTNLTITAYWFYGLKSLTTITGISYLNTANVTNMYCMFYGCSGLTSLELSGFNTENVTNMIGMFQGCSGLTSLDLSGFKTDNVRGMANMFAECRGLTSLDLSGLKTDNVTDMSRMFVRCSGLTSLDVSGFKTDNVTDMAFMFFGCSGLTSLNVSGFNTENVTDMSGMFESCSGLMSLDVSVFKTDNVTKMGYMFYGCSALTTIYVGEGWSTANVTDSGSMFNGCTSLIGGASTAYDESHTNHTYAHIDGGPSNPGYFTDIEDFGREDEPYAVLSNDNTVLTFYYDKHKEAWNGMSVGPFHEYPDYQSWKDYSASITRVVFDASFAECTSITSTAYWFINCSNLTEIIGLENLNTENVTDMSNMFSNCSSLTSLDLSSFNTVSLWSMYGMFAYCSSLASIDLSSFNTASVNNMGNMFEGCSSLTTLDLSSFNTASVMFMYDMFSGCSSLTSLDLSHFNTASVWSMFSMFYHCSSLTSLDLSSFNTASVTDMGTMFAGCSSLTSLDLSSFNTSSVTKMGSMFDGCSHLTTLDLSNFITASVTDMDCMFRDCSGLTSLDLSNFNTESVTDMTGMFFDCSSLTSLDLSGFNTANVTSMGRMFYGGMFSGCSSLTILDLSSFNTANVKDMRKMFNDCSALTTIYVGEEWSVTNVNESADMFSGCTSLVGGQGTTFDANHTDYTYAHIDGGISNPGYFTSKNAPIIKESEPYAVLSDDNTVLTFYYDNKKEERGGMSVGPLNYAPWTLITQVVFDTSFAECTTITSTSHWFYRCDRLTSITGIENLNTENVTNMSDMFYGCSRLTSLDLSNFNTANVTNMSRMFEGCSRLTSLDLSNFTAANVTDLSRMFYGCSDLTSLDVSNFNTANVTNMSYLFSFCSSLTSLDLSNFNTANVTDMSNMFSTCSNLASLDLSNFNTSSVTNMGMMFCVCSRLTSLDVSNFNTGNVTDMYAMFSGCYSLTSLDVSNFNTANVTSMSSMFSGCRGLTSLDLSNFNTANVTNMSKMFSGCNRLTSLDVSSFNTANVADMSNMFRSCNDLASIGLSNFNTANVTSMFEMFAGCRVLTSLDLSNFNTVNVTDMSNMFLECYGLTSLDVSNFNTANVTNMRFMFQGCSSLTRLDLSSFNTLSVTKMDSMFQGCSSLTSLDVSNFNTANVTELHDMFLGCSSLTSLDLSNFNTANVTYMYSMFRGCSKLSTIYVGNEWSTANVTNGNNMFIDCTSLVGGNGTTYDENHTDYTYAHIDGGPSNPGYFSDKYEAADYVTVTIEAEGAGRIRVGETDVEDETRTVKVPKGLNTVLELLPDEGYQLVKLTVGETDVTEAVADNRYVIQNIASDTTVYAIFMEDIENFVVDGIRYGVTNLAGGEVKVIAGDYAGALNIPSTVAHESREWQVTGLDARALRGCPWLVSVSVPQSVTTVGQDLFKKDRRLAAIRWEAPVRMDRQVMGDFTNPNLLLYVADTQYAPAAVQNIIVNGVADRIVLTDIAGDGNCDFFCPETFTARHISYQHAYTQQTLRGKSQGWETLALPFDVQAVNHERQGVIHPFAALTEEAIDAGARPFWLYTYIDGDTYARAESVKAYTPFIISMPNDPSYEAEYILGGLVTFSAENVTVAATPDTETMTTGTQRLFTPCFTREPNGQNLLCINSYEFYATKAEGSVFVRNLRAARPFEAYFRFADGGAVKEWFPVFDETTGIEEINNEKGKIKNEKRAGAMFDLSGRRMADGQLPRGVYIHNGKKVIKN